MTINPKVTRVTVAVFAVVAALVVAACTGSSGVDLQDPDAPLASTSTSDSSTTPTTSNTATTPTSSGTSSATAPSTTDSTGLIVPTTETEPISPQEAADRAAVEKAWLNYQRVAGELWKEPSGTWKAALEEYAGQPILTQALENGRKFVEDGKGNWGQPVHHVYSVGPINGAATSDLGDCIDASKTGSMDVKTGKKLTRGVEHQNTLVTLVRRGDNWKVSTVTYAPNLACPGAPTANEEKASILAATSASTTKTSR